MTEETKAPQEELEQANEVSSEVIEGIEGLPEELSPEEIEKARKQLQEDFNKRFSKWAVISDEPADDEFLEKAKQDLEDEAQKIRSKEYVLAQAEDNLPLKTAEFLKEWNSKYAHWKLSEWRGVIQFDRVISNKIEELKANPESPLLIDYPTLIYLYERMKEPKGTGLEAARYMAEYENYDETSDKPKEDSGVVLTYSGVLERIFNYIRELTAYDKKLNILARRRDLAYATAKMDLKIEAIEEFIEFFDAIQKTAVEENHLATGKK